MRPSPARDLVVGLFVLAGLGAIAYLSLSVGGVEIGRAARMPLYATFDEIGGLKPRAQVVISGVSVGKVAAIELDAALRARVRLEVEPSLALPTDTSAAIRTSGLLGDQYVALEPGGETETLKAGEEVAFVENALSIERLIGKFVHDSGIESKEGPKE